MIPERSFNPSLTWATLATQHASSCSFVGTVENCTAHDPHEVECSYKITRAEDKAVQPLSFVVGRTFITIDDHLQGCKMTEDVTWLGRTNFKNLPYPKSAAGHPNGSDFK
jgi:hypothetical protein